jgi:hypothetical protein
MSRRGSGFRWCIAIVIATVTVLALPAAAAEKRNRSADQLSHFSQSVAISSFARSPSQAPPAAKSLADAVRAARAGGAHRETAPSAAAVKGRGVFNNDVLGVPQNEESVTACKVDPAVVLGGTNDYRGLFETPSSVTGWHFSNDGGRTLANEGRLPPVTTSAGVEIESGGDPVDVAGTRNEAGTDPGCDAMYAGSLAYDVEAEDPTQGPNGVAVYRTTPGTLETCGGATDPSCWPTKTLVAEGAPSHFLDKEWFDVGVSGSAGEVVWVTYSNFTVDPAAPLGFTSAEIEAVRCDRDLSNCTAPIPISEDDFDVQFSDVTIAPDGRVYVTWSEIICELPDDPDCTAPEEGQKFVHKIRIAEAGSTDFGPERIVHREDMPIPFGGHLHANDFRAATVPKNDVALVGPNGTPRIFVVWDACRFRPLTTVCEEPLIKLRFSDDDGASWSDVMELSRGGDNYFPSIVSNDATRPTLAFTWFTNRFDATFHNRQDVEFLTMDPANLHQGALRRLTGSSNEPEADPLLGGLFIGDYIEVFATGNNAWVHYNANYLQKPLLEPLGEVGIPVAQQDNFLVPLRIPGHNDNG